MCKNDKNVKDFEIPHIFIWIDIHVLQHEKNHQKPNPKWLFLVHAH